MMPPTGWVLIAIASHAVFFTPTPMIATASFLTSVKEISEKAHFRMRSTGH
jgi:hypothetical protein